MNTLLKTAASQFGEDVKNNALGGALMTGADLAYRNHKSGGGAVPGALAGAALGGIDGAIRGGAGSVLSGHLGKEVSEDKQENLLRAMYSGGAGGFATGSVTGAVQGRGTKGSLSQGMDSAAEGILRSTLGSSLRGKGSIFQGKNKQ